MLLWLFCLTTFFISIPYESKAAQSRPDHVVRKADKSVKKKSVSKPTKSRKVSSKVKRKRYKKRAKYKKKSISKSTKSRKVSSKVKRKRYKKRAKYSKVSKKRRSARTRKKSSRSSRKLAGKIDDFRKIFISASSALVKDASNGEILYKKNAQEISPIASISKLMTAMVVLDHQQDLKTILKIDSADVDRLKMTKSHLPIGTLLSREIMLNLSLMYSENRAASSLSRHFPGGRKEFVRKMNQKAKEIGLRDTYFADPTGLNPKNRSTAFDLAKLVAKAYEYPLISAYTTAFYRYVNVNGEKIKFKNTNKLLAKDSWKIDVSKTGYIREAGRCLVLRTWIGQRPVIIVVLDSRSTAKRFEDVRRLRLWAENATLPVRHGTSG